MSEPNRADGPGGQPDDGQLRNYGYANSQPHGQAPYGPDPHGHGHHPPDPQGQWYYGHVPWENPPYGQAPQDPHHGSAPAQPGAEPSGAHDAAVLWAQPDGTAPVENPLQRGRHTAGRGEGELGSAQILRMRKWRPRSGWRRAVHVGSGGLINPGESPAELRQRELAARVNKPLPGTFRIAMLSLKGGVGKTTITSTLGATFASLRGDRVVALDANPDRGTLAQKVPLGTTATVRDLINDADGITRYSEMRAYTSQADSRMEIVASEQDPAVSEAFSEQEYRTALDLLEHFYNIVLTDCGTGMLHSAMRGVLDTADAVVLISSGALDGARSASATLDWLDKHGYGVLVQRSVAVINSARPSRAWVNLDQLEKHFNARTRAVCRIPFDPHLEEGAEIDLDRLHKKTRADLLALAATVADGFPDRRTARSADGQNV